MEMKNNIIIIVLYTQMLYQKFVVYLLVYIDVWYKHNFFHTIDSAVISSVLAWISKWWKNAKKKKVIPLCSNVLKQY